MEARTHYTRVGDQWVAYQAFGSGPVDIVVIDQWFSNVDLQWEVPPLARLLERIASFSRVIVLDKRGTGLSDPVRFRGQGSFEEWMDDLTAVLDAAGSSRTAIVAGIAGGFLGAVFAATFPQRVSSLVLVDAFAHGTRSDDYPCGLPEDVLRGNLALAEERWGEGVLIDFLGPGLAADRGLRRQFARYERNSTSPSGAAFVLRMIYESDIREILPAIRVPTLVVHHADAVRLPVCHGEYLAAHIPNARLVTIGGTDNFLWAGDQQALVAEIQEFVTGLRPPPEPDRVLATVLFTDIVGSTERAARLGDRRWRELLDQHHGVVRAELARFRGREIDTAGDGFLATFDGPARGIRCARAICEAVRPLDLEVRAGLHVGEIELLGDDIGGIAVHIAARVAALAGGSEVLVSRTLTDLVTGSGIEFEARGDHDLKGVPGRWELFRVANA